MDPLIIESTPKGSAILAYGAARGPQWNGKLLAVVVGGLILVGLIAIAIWMKSTHVSLPKQTLVSAIIIPAQIEKHLTTELKKDLPAPWRAALESQSHFPAVLGASLNDGRLHAYALVARTASVAAATGLDVTPSGSFNLLTDGSHPETEKMTTGQALQGAFGLRQHAAIFTIQSSLLESLADSKADHVTNDAVQGTWDGLVGHFTLQDEQTSSASPLLAPMFVVLGSRRDDAQAAVVGLLSQGIDLRSLSQPPETIALDPANGGSVSLSWNQELSASDAAMLGVIRGTGLRKPYQLMDSSEATEILPNVSSSTFSAAQTVILSDHLASSTLLSFETQPIKAGCPGKNVRFTLQSDALQALLNSWNVPDSWRSLLSSVRLTQSGHDAYICLETK